MGITRDSRRRTPARLLGMLQYRGLPVELQFPPVCINFPHPPRIVLTSRSSLQRRHIDTKLPHDDGLRKSFKTIKYELAQISHEIIDQAMDVTPPPYSDVQRLYTKLSVECVLLCRELMIDARSNEMCRFIYAVDLLHWQRRLCISTRAWRSVTPRMSINEISSARSRWAFNCQSNQL